MSKKQINLTIYDFDGTLYYRDSLLEFWKFIVFKDLRVICFLPYQIIIIILWIFRILSTDQFKSKFLSFLNIFSKKQIQNFVETFWEKNDAHIYPWVGAMLRQDKAEGAYLLCISASPSFLLKDIVAKLGFDHLICTEMIETHDKQTNKLKSPNCKGKEKVRRLYQWAEGESFELNILKMVSDLEVDRPLYNLADKKYKVIKGEVKEID